MPDEIAKWVRVMASAGTFAALVYFLAPQSHSLWGLLRTVLTAFLTSTGMFLWWYSGGPLTEYQQVVLICIVAAVSDFLLVALLKLLVMLKNDPLKTVQKLRVKK
jgi:hypothetical protein|tara:strand:+ start:3258 stop:3572 length:315 start_codon:yes stop_codon:yes gene_type:complete